MRLGLGTSLINRSSVVSASGDADASAYIAAVEAADGQALETGVKAAITNFVVGCKSDSIWDAIKASCILAGARTLSGALVPLRGTAPTNYNFVSGDYNRKIGLVGDGSTKYLDSNRNVNADPQNNFSMSVFPASLGPTSTAYIGAGGTDTGSSMILESGIGQHYRNRNSLADSGTNTENALIGMSRGSAASYIVRSSSTSTVFTRTSETPYNGNALVFARNSPTVGLHSNARLSFYSIGEHLDLAALDSRVSRLMAELAFTINTSLVATPYDIDTLLYINSGYGAGGTLA